MSTFDQRWQRVDTQINIAVIQPPDRPPLQRPPRATHFTGREEELAQLLIDLQPGRVVTLSGPGGVGKTALAAEAIWIMAPGDDPPERFPDGILFHSFYTQPQAALALEAIARAYGEEPRPSPADAARRALAGRRALLVLDGAENADDLGAVLAVAGGCGVLVTSRRRGDAVAEWQDVAPLPEPKAVQLLQAWGGDRATDEVAARRICELVGGLPLAVRLAGRYLAQREEDAADYLAWLEETPLTALDHGDRQGDSVPLLLERSLAQVSEGARAALAGAGVLAPAPFGREAVAAALEVPAAEAGRTLGELVDYGLLLRSEERYQASHALVHTYARERLAPSVGVVARLAGHYTALAEEQSELGLSGYARLDAERPHLMAVVATCIAQKNWRAAYSLALTVDSYLSMQGHWTQRIIAAEAGLTAARALNHRRGEGTFLFFLGFTCRDLGDTEKAIEHHEQALIIAQETGDRLLEEICVGNLGMSYLNLGRMELAIKQYERALAMSREVGDRRNEGAWSGHLGFVYAALGQWQRTIESYEQALSIAREIGDRINIGAWLGNLGSIFHYQGQFERAMQYFEQALAIAREVGDRRNEGAWLARLGSVYRCMGQVEQAIEYIEQGLRIIREIHAPLNEGFALCELARVHRDLRQIERATEYYHQALAIFTEIKSPYDQQVLEEMTELRDE